MIFLFLVQNGLFLLWEISQWTTEIFASLLLFSFIFLGVMADTIHLSDEESEDDYPIDENDDNDMIDIVEEQNDHDNNDSNDNNNDSNDNHENNDTEERNGTDSPDPEPKNFEGHDLQAVKHSRVHPNFLNSNSTSHIWAFGAIAELIDNATDPDVQAKSLKIDVLEPDSENPMLMLTDNGNGASPGTLHKMVSFGFSEKVCFSLSNISVIVVIDSF